MPSVCLSDVCRQSYPTTSQIAVQSLDYSMMGHESRLIQYEDGSLGGIREKNFGFAVGEKLADGCSYVWGKVSWIPSSIWGKLSSTASFVNNLVSRVLNIIPGASAEPVANAQPAIERDANSQFEQLMAEHRDFYDGWAIKLSEIMAQCSLPNTWPLCRDEAREAILTYQNEHEQFSSRWMDELSEALSQKEERSDSEQEASLESDDIERMYIDSMAREVSVSLVALQLDAGITYLESHNPSNTTE